MQQKYNLQISSPSILHAGRVLVQSVHILHVLSAHFFDILPVHWSASWVLSLSANSGGTVRAPELCGIVWILSCDHGILCNIQLNTVQSALTLCKVSLTLTFKMKHMHCIWALIWTWTHSSKIFWTNLTSWNH